jgi:energy-coupling factor transporter transmembrane protein EcfT
MFRFVPILAQEAELIVCAQMSRGGGRRRDRLAMIIPLLLRALTRARKVAEAMTMRGFQ